MKSAYKDEDGPFKHIGMLGESYTAFAVIIRTRDDGGRSWKVGAVSTSRHIDIGHIPTRLSSDATEKAPISEEGPLKRKK